MFRMRPSVPMFTSRLGAVLVTVFMKATSAWSAAWRRSFWSARRAASTVAPTTSGSASSRLSYTTAAIRSPRVVDELQRLGLGRGGVGYRPALRIHPAATGEAAVLVEPVEDAELVVAESIRERVADRPAGVEGVHELCDGGLLQARSAETASPDSSALGTNPRADDSATS